MEKVRVTRDDFLRDRQGKTFSDVVNDLEQPFDIVLDFFADTDRQQRMEESELHHDRSPLAGVVRELESHDAVDGFLAGAHAATQRALASGDRCPGPDHYGETWVAKDGPQRLAWCEGHGVGIGPIPQCRRPRILVRASGTV